MRKIAGATLTALLLTACAPTTLSQGPASGHLRAGDAASYLPTRQEPVAGAMEGVAYTSDTLTLAPGDGLLLYTDGVTEAMNLQDDLYSEERLLAVAAERQRQSVGELIKGITSSIRDFAADAPQSDDITLMAIGYRGPGER